MPARRTRPTRARRVRTRERAPAIPHENAVLDDAIRDVAVSRTTEDEQLLNFPSPSQAEFTHTDTWRVMRILGEFIEGFDRLASLDKAVTVFGSARVGADDPHYLRAEETARLLARA